MVKSLKKDFIENDDYKFIISQYFLLPFQRGAENIEINHYNNTKTSFDCVLNSY